MACDVDPTCAALRHDINLDTAKMPSHDAPSPEEAAEDVDMSDAPQPRLVALL